MTKEELAFGMAEHMDALILQSVTGEIETGDLEEFRNAILAIRDQLPSMEKVSNLAGVTVDWGWRLVETRTTEEGHKELMEVRTGTPGSDLESSISQ